MCLRLLVLSSSLFILYRWPVAPFPHLSSFCKAPKDSLICDRHSVNKVEVVHTVSEAGLWLQWVWFFLLLLYCFRLGRLIVHGAAH